MHVLTNPKVIAHNKLTEHSLIVHTSYSVIKTYFVIHELLLNFVAMHCKGSEFKINHLKTQIPKKKSLKLLLKILRQRL